MQTDRRTDMTLVTWNGAKVPPKGEPMVQVTNSKNRQSSVINFLMVQQSANPILICKSVKNLDLILLHYISHNVERVHFRFQRRNRKAVNNGYIKRQQDCWVHITTEKARSVRGWRRIRTVVGNSHRKRCPGKSRWTERLGESNSDSDENIGETTHLHRPKTIKQSTPKEALRISCFIWNYIW